MGAQGTGRASPNGGQEGERGREEEIREERGGGRRGRENKKWKNRKERKEGREEKSVVVARIRYCQISALSTMSPLLSFPITFPQTHRIMKPSINNMATFHDPITSHELYLSHCCPDHQASPRKPLRIILDPHAVFGAVPHPISGAPLLLSQIKAGEPHHPQSP